MDNLYPKVCKINNMLNIQLKPLPDEKKSVNLEFVLDINLYGDVVGIEIFNLRNRVGDKVLDGFDKLLNLKSKSMHLSFDEENDAFYFAFSHDRSSDQRVVDGFAILNTEGNLIGFEINVE